MTAKTPPKLPRREATAKQAMLAIAMVFFLGIAIGFVLAQTVRESRRRESRDRVRRRLPVGVGRQRARAGVRVAVAGRGGSQPVREVATSGGRCAPACWG